MDRLAGLHDRMPLPIDLDAMDAGLTPKKLPSADAGGILVDRVRDQTYRAASAWTLDEVDPAVGNVRSLPCPAPPINHTGRPPWTDAASISLAAVLGGRRMTTGRIVRWPVETYTQGTAGRWRAIQPWGTPCEVFDNYVEGFGVTNVR